MRRRGGLVQLAHGRGRARLGKRRRARVHRSDTPGGRCRRRDRSRLAGRPRVNAPRHAADHRTAGPRAAEAATPPASLYCFLLVAGVIDVPALGPIELARANRCAAASGALDSGDGPPPAKRPGARPAPPLQSPRGAEPPRRWCRSEGLRRAVTARRAVWQQRGRRPAARCRVHRRLRARGCARPTRRRFTGTLAATRRAVAPPEAPAAGPRGALGPRRRG